MEDIKIDKEFKVRFSGDIEKRIMILMEMYELGNVDMHTSLTHKLIMGVFGRLKKGDGVTNFSTLQRKRVIDIMEQEYGVRIKIRTLNTYIMELRKRGFLVMDADGLTIFNAGFWSMIHCNHVKFNVHIIHE